MVYRRLDNTLTAEQVKSVLCTFEEVQHRFSQTTQPKTILGRQSNSGWERREVT